MKVLSIRTSMAAVSFALVLGFLLFTAERPSSYATSPSVASSYVEYPNGATVGRLNPITNYRMLETDLPLKAVTNYVQSFIQENDFNTFDPIDLVEYLQGRIGPGSVGFGDDDDMEYYYYIDATGTVCKLCYRTTVITVQLPSQGGTIVVRLDRSMAY